MDTFAYTARLPAKRMAAGVLIFTPQQELLIVKPTYRDEWLIPGGVVEADESPLGACTREVREELGLDLPIGRLLCLEYQAQQPDRTESLQFVFAGDVLQPATIAQIRLPKFELSGYQFLAPADALPLLNPRLSRRVQYALTALAEQRTLYVENGSVIT